MNLVLDFPAEAYHRIWRMRLRSFLTLAAALCAGCWSLAATTPPLPDLPKLNMANTLPAVRGQVERAYLAARAHPRDAEANGKLGMVLDAYEQFESAAVCYRRAHLLDPAASRWLYYLGWVEAARGKYEDAVGALRAALQIDPGYLPAQLKLAETLLVAGNWEEGSVIYEAIIEDHPDSATAVYGLGRVNAARGDDKAAAESFQKACEFFPAYGASHYALALLYRKFGDTPKAQEHLILSEQNKTTVPPVDDPLRDAVRELNQGPLAHIRRGTLLEQAGKTQEAIAEHEKALEVDPRHVQAHINLISLYGRLRQFEKAEEHYRAAVGLDPDRADAHYNYGVLLFEQGKYREADQAFRKAVEINPFYAEAHNNLGSLLEQQGRLVEALEQYRQAVQNQPEYRLAHFHLGRILVNQNNYDDAIQHFLKTLTPEDENTPRYLYALAAAYARSGDREKALKFARKAREQAAARGQTRLLTTIEKDIRALEQEGAHH